MRKVAMIIIVMVMAAIISGCTVSADADTDVTYPILNKIKEEDDEPYRFDIEEVIEELAEPEEETHEVSSVLPGGASWIFAKTQDGSSGIKTTRYERLYNRNKDLLSRIEIPEATQVVDAKPTIYEGGQVAKAGAFYHASRITRFGADCYGCNVSADGSSGSTSGVGLGMNSVQQKDGTWKKGITYEGYYIVATSQEIPLFSIIEINNHTISGMGITPGVPFKAIVLDRGGAITGSKIDLFVGRENNMPVSQGKRPDAEVDIISIDNGNMAPIVIKEPEPKPEPVVQTQAPATENVETTQSANSNEISRITRYGADCYGCNISSDGRGATASGVGVGIDSVKQKNGTWEKGITYEGYYIVAASSDIPLFSIVEISDHTVSGMGIQSGVPFKAIVLDRGGAITGSKIDLFVGRENNMPVNQGSRQNAQIKIIG